MSKQLNFVYKDVEYTLEFTRRTVEQMEREGFVADDVKVKPMTPLPTLFAGAFKAHHKFVKPDTINEIYAKMTDKAGLIAALAAAASQAEDQGSTQSDHSFLHLHREGPPF